MGSCFEYKIKNNSKIKETHKIKPINNYAKAKNKLRQFVKKKLVKTQILHGADCFMSGARGSPKELFLDNLKVKKIKLSPFFLQNPEISLDYLNVKDVAKYIYYLSINNKNNYETNICSGRKISLGSLVSYWKRIYKLKIIYKKAHTKKSLKIIFMGQMIS